MIISRLILKNWRNFRTFDVEFSDRVFLVGPNASGKSNVLDAIRFLRDIAKPGGGLQTAVHQRSGLSRIRCLSARKDPDVEVELHLGSPGEPPEWRYGIGLTQEPGGRRECKLQFERVWQRQDLLVDRPDAQDRTDPPRLTQTHLEQIGANAGFRQVSHFLESIRYLHLVPQLLKYPELSQSPVSAEDPFGKSFLEQIAKTPKATQASRLRRVEEAIRKAVPYLKNLELKRDEATGAPHLEALYEHWNPKAGKQREDQFSDGTLRLIGLLWSLLDGNAPLLLEEPELSLHSGIVQKLPAIFSRVQRQRKRQLLVSTHSWDLLSDKGIGGEEVVLLEPGPEGTVARLASSVDEVRTLLKSGLSVADAALPRTKPAAFDQISFDLR
jgi:predicted ATPase